MKHKLTKSDIDLNPFFAQHGFKEGDELDIPAAKNVTSSVNNSDDTGGSKPPPDKERPDKP